MRFDVNTGEADSLRNLDETAEFFEVSVPTLRDWIAGGCPVVEEGGQGRPYKLDLRQVHKWRLERNEAARRQAEERVAADAQLKLELLGADSLVVQANTPSLSGRAHSELVRAELDRIALAERRGELVKAADVEATLREAFAACRDRLRTMPDQLAQRLGLADAIADAMLAEVDAALAELAALLQGHGQHDAVAA